MYTLHSKVSVAASLSGVTGGEDQLRWAGEHLDFSRA